LTPKLMIMVLL